MPDEPEEITPEDAFDEEGISEETVEDAEVMPDEPEEITPEDAFDEEGVSEEVVEDTEVMSDEPEEITPEDAFDEGGVSEEVVEEDAVDKEAAGSEPEGKEGGEGEKKVGWFARLKAGLAKTRDDMNYKINDILGNYVKVDDDMLEDLEDLLISSDIGMETTMLLIDNLKESIRERQIQDPKDVRPLLVEEIQKILEKHEDRAKLQIEPSPAVILIVGVNGVGKTTTIGKLAHRFKQEGKSVLIAAADTFRAAAIEQVETWGERSNTPVISHKEGADPAAVVYDAIQAQKARNIDVLICDTAGRLHNKKNLMNELEKIHRIIEKESPNAQKESLLVLDATTGQNAILQAKSFDEVTHLTGIVLTKLDGTAKGGVVLPLIQELDIPIKLIGVGEGMEDLQDFSGKDFADALVNME
ncbi:MAG: signal recognition particle-docking protein FtsY [Firmicutes bacterium]|nr:signal recognition particle-docking protein FtsY [Bacillota bacterium]